MASIYTRLKRTLDEIRIDLARSLFDVMGWNSIMFQSAWHTPQVELLFLQGIYQVGAGLSATFRLKRPDTTDLVAHEEDVEALREPDSVTDVQFG